MTSVKAENCEHMSEIRRYYEGKTIFMTGATGFLGHILLAKLLRSCPEVGTIYMLMREKKGINPSDRFKKMFENEIFADVETYCPDYKNKVKAIIGDCLQPNLGFSPNEEKILIDKVDIVFHIAATVRFDAPIQYAVNMNIRSTDDLIRIAHKMTKLKAFVYVSTAFSNCSGRKVIEEKFYETPVAADSIMTITEKLNPDMLEKITPTLLGGYANTYVYTKAIAEDLCQQKGAGLPLVIFRPAIVTSTEKEPVPGWINNVYGPTGIAAATAVGLLRTMHADPDCVASVVPCDYVINCLLATAWDITEKYSHSNSTESNSSKKVEPTNEMPIYNFSNHRNPLTWRRFCEDNAQYEPIIPSNLSIWAFTLTINKNTFIHQLYCLFLHLLPALIVDGVAKIVGKEAKLWDAYQKIHKLLNVISYFSTKQWDIIDDNVFNLWNKLSEEDKKIFYFNMEDLDWKKYAAYHIRGIRQYVIKDPDSTIPAAKKRRFRLLAMHYTLIGAIVSFMCYGVFSAIRFIANRM